MKQIAAIFFGGPAIYQGGYQAQRSGQQHLGGGEDEPRSNNM